jgi:tetratricopeptide (TPR) repeat protein
MTEQSRTIRGRPRLTRGTTPLTWTAASPIRPTATTIGRSQISRKQSKSTRGPRRTKLAAMPSRPRATTTRPSLISTRRSESTRTTPNPINNRGAAYITKGENGRAIADYSKAIEINPRHASAYYNRGAAFRARGEIDRALADYTQAIEINPRYANAFLSRGIAFEASGDNDRAIADFTKAIEITPRNADAASLTVRSGKSTKQSWITATRLRSTHSMQPLTTVAATPSRPAVRLTVLSRIIMYSASKAGLAVRCRLQAAPTYSPASEFIIDADIHQLNVSGIAGELVTSRESTG